MQKIQLTIPEPCHENWENMIPGEQGRFCSSCAKTVVDFSMMSDTEVLNYFSTLQDAKVCGRALPAQLNRAITMPREPKKRLFWYWNYIVLFFMLFSKSNQSKAQTKGEVVTIPIKPTCTKALGAMKIAPLIKQTEHVITGKIIATDETPVPFATVMIQGTRTGVSANAKGLYSIKVKNGDVLEFSSPGFERMQITVSQNVNNIVVKLQQPKILEGVVVTALGIKGHARLLGSITVKSDTVKKADTTVIKTLPATQPQTLMGGMVKGVQVDLCNNGSTQVKLGRVRSGSHIDYPLLVVNGVEYPMSYLATLNPKDIESVTVFKSSATHLWDNPDNGIMSITIKKKGEDNAKIVKGSIAKTFVNKITDTIYTVVNPNTVRIYPNPIQKGNAFIVSLHLKQTGTINLQVTDASGIVLLKKQSTLTEKDTIEKIQTDVRWGSGVYFLTVFDSNNKLINKKSFIVQ